MNLRERIAKTLGWTIEQTQQFSAQTLRELVRGKDDKLVTLISTEIRNGSYIKPESPSRRE